MKQAGVLAIIVMSLALLAPTAFASTVNWLPDSGGDWRDVNNWSSAPFLPGLGDDVFIDCPGIATISYPKIDSIINSLYCVESLNFAGGSLAVMAPSQIKQGLSINGGTLDLESPLAISGSSLWMSGNVKGWGGLINSGNLIIDGATKYLDAGLLVNYGTITHKYGPLYFMNYAVLENRAGGLYDLQNGGFSASGPGGQINNLGTFRKSMLASSTDIQFPFNNTGGTVDVQIGSLNLRNGGIWDGGTISIADKAALLLTGQIVLGGNINASGTGAVRMDYAQATIPAGSTPTFNMVGTGLTMYNSTINASGSLINQGYGTLTGGLIKGSGGLENRGVISIEHGNFILDGSKLVNTGTVSQTSGQITLANSAAINNAAGALYEMRYGYITPNGPNPGQVFNYGTFRKPSAEATNSDVGVAFNNVGGNIEVEYGQLVLREGGISDNTNISTAHCAALLLGGTHTFAGTTSITGLGGVISDPQSTLYIPAGANVISSMADYGSLMLNGTVKLVGHITNTGSATLDLNSVLNGRGGFDNLGSLTINGGARLDNAQLNNSGSISQSGSAIALVNSSVIKNTPEGLYSIDGAGIVQSGQYNCAFENSGLLCKTGSGTTGVSVTFRNTGGTTDIQAGNLILFNGGYFAGGTIKLNDTVADLKGPFTFADRVAITGPGIIQLAESTHRTQPSSQLILSDPRALLVLNDTQFGGSGTIDVAGSFSQDLSSALVTTISSTTSYGRMRIGGMASLSGALVVELAPGYIPALGDEFIVLSCGSLEGSFTALDAPTLSNGLKFEVAYEPYQVKLVVKADQPAKELASIASAKSEVEGTFVRVKGYVTAVFEDSFYIEDASRLGGIRVQGKPAPNPPLPMPLVSQLATVDGTLDVVDGNLTLTDSVWYIDPPSSDLSIKPLFITGRIMGGSALGLQPGVKDGVGLNNIGILVKMFGKITYVDPAGAFAYISDGSKLNDGNKLGEDGSTIAGLRVLFVPGFGAPSVGDRVILTGISATADVEGSFVRALRLPAEGLAFAP